MAGNNYAEPTAAREAEIPSAIGALFGGVGSLHEAVTALEKRASPLCRPHSDEKAQGCGRIASCAVAGQVFEAVASIDSLTARIRDLLDRLEI